LSHSFPRDIACIAMTSTVMLFLAKGWIGKDFKTKAD